MATNISKLLKAINPVMLVVLVFQLITGLSHQYISAKVFLALHLSGALVLALLVSLHIMLNWKWVKSNYF